MKKAVHCGFAILLFLATACSMPHSSLAQGRSSAFGSRAEGSFDRTLNVSGIVDLEVSTGSGGIDIKRGSSNRVQIHGVVRTGDRWWRSSSDSEAIVRRLEANPPIEQSGQTIRVGRITDRDLERNVSISYEIVVPAQSNVRAHSGSGGQSVEGIEGRVEVSTGSGGITVRDIRGDLDARAGSGSIRATAIRGGVRLHTGSGGSPVQGA